jgi:exo-beta-1,3-glucanase (GH17 family)
MARRYSFESNEDPFNAMPPPPSQPAAPRYQQPPLSVHPIHPGAHPESSFDRLRAVRRHSQGPNNYGQPISPISPAVPPHRDPQGRYWGQELGYSNSMASNTTPGADNFGEQAGGGISGIALSVADANARESGLEAVRSLPGYHQQHDDPMAYNNQHNYQQHYDPQHISPYDGQEYIRPGPRQEGSQSSLTPLGLHAQPPASISPHSFQEQYSDTPYNHYSRNLDPGMGGFDPNSIEDDGDEGLEYLPHRGSRLSLTPHHTDRSNGAPAGAAAATGGVLGTIGGFVGRSANGNAPQYGPVSNPQLGYEPGSYDLGAQEKSEWLKRQSSSRKKWTWIAGSILVVIILGGIAAGVAVPLLNKKNSSSSSSSSSSSGSGTAATDTQQNGDLGSNSAEIQALMNNKNLHKVFPGMDYTPINTQYPDCLVNPPSQNNVTRDLAVLSQLTNVVRLYGTDCNQTEMLLHSIDRLGLKGQVKVWLGVWQDNNATTNARQLAQMYKILDTYGTDQFLGVIVGNEILFNQYMTETALEAVLTGVRANFTAKNINLPIATSDLGDKWTSTLANAVDYVMANVHPFFAGVEVGTAAAWTMNFFQTHDTMFKTDSTKSIISETGWPSAGGTDCGGATTCTTGSVAGTSEMNTFMNDWVCQALANGTNYFWFEAFDEPWKIRYDEPGKEWEDKWGLMDINRNLKNGVVIPDCGGKTVGSV